MSGLPESWLNAAFAGVVLSLLVCLFVWGIALQRLVVRLERAHPAWFEALRVRSRRKARRLAVVSELQSALFRGEAPPASVLADPAAARLIGVEVGVRRLVMPLALAGFLLFAVA